jgi:hypothetical protein
VEPIFVREGDDRALIDHLVEQRIEVADDARIIGIRVLLADLGQVALHGRLHLAFADLLVADLDERGARQSEARDPGSEVGQIGECEPSENGEQDRGHEPGADFRFRKATEESEHLRPRIKGGMGEL